MVTRRRQQFVHAQLVWMLAAVIVLSLLDTLTLELFFVISLVGLLAVVELTAPFAITPGWRRRLRWIVALGLVVFTGIVVRRILEVLPAGVL